jgi:hypothetical protein
MIEAKLPIFVDLNVGTLFLLSFCAWSGVSQADGIPLRFNRVSRPAAWTKGELVSILMECAMLVVTLLWQRVALSQLLDGAAPVGIDWLSLVELQEMYPPLIAVLVKSLSEFAPTIQSFVVGKQVIAL